MVYILCMNSDKNKADKIKILEQALKDVPFDGWTIDTFEQAAEKQELERLTIKAFFPRGLNDILDFFAIWADDQMIASLENIDQKDLRIHERIHLAVEKRINILTPHKEAVRETAKIMTRPQYARTGAHITWQTADRIWDWAGDTSTDYNRYTKRGLLSGVIGSTMLYWLNDDSDNAEKTNDFLSNRIQNVLFIGKNASPIIKPVASLLERVMMRSKV